MIGSRYSFLYGIFFLALLLAATVPSNAQQQRRVNLEKAKVFRGGRTPDGERFQRLIGNVIFTQANTTIYCDSAHFFKSKNSLDAFGQVRIVEGDSVDITGRKLQYEGDRKLARMRNNVVFTKKGTSALYTDYLDYMRGSNVVYYFNGGRLVDSVNVLTSRNGHYNMNTGVATFLRNVKVVNKDYTMYSDSLEYNSKTKVIHFISKTTIVQNDSSTFSYETGYYNTITKSYEVKSGVAESDEYTIVGDRVDVDGIRNIARIRGNVVLTHKHENLVIYGQASDHFKSEGITKIYDNAYVAKITDRDTLFMRADTLVSIDNKDSSKRKLLAYNNVKIFKSDMQGKADSVEYRTSDSTIYFYQDPVLWSSGNQLTADSIRMQIRNNTIDKLYLTDDAFVISRDTLFNFNQIKGRQMTASISNGKISNVLVEGNGESLYFALDENNEAFMGMNRIICSSILIRFRDGRVHNLSFYVKPEANFIPPKEIKEEDMKLDGFDWQVSKKPTRSDVIPQKQLTPNPGSK